MKLECRYYNDSSCRSCEGLEIGLDQWQKLSLDQLQKLLVTPKWLAPKLSNKSFGSRNKVKLAVGGCLDRPLIGRFTSAGEVIDLEHCQLHSELIRSKASSAYQWIKDFKLEPYNIQTRKGELKSIIIVEGDNQSLMIRFVLRSKESVDRIRNLATLLCEEHPDYVVSVNIQPKPSATLEGDEEILLSEKSLLDISYNDRVLKLPTKSFVQTNHEVASKLYQTAGEWTKDMRGRFLELFCGIGGFSSHLIKSDRVMVGIELSQSAIEAAQIATPSADFRSMDAWEYLKSSPAFDTIIVNPPRRGLGNDICQRLNSIKAKNILYSSCNPDTLRKDLENLNYKIEKIQAFEMFPLTSHWEVLTLLSLDQE